MSHSQNSRFHPRRGFVQLWFAVMGLMLIGFMGLAIDAGHMVHTGNQLQSAAEAAALAGAQELWKGTSFARDAAVAMGPLNTASGVAISLDRNNANTPSGDVVLGYFDETLRTFDPAATTLNACKVVAHRDSTRNGQLTLWFASIFGAGTMDISRSAIAVSSGVGNGPAFAVLDNTNTTRTLDLSGRISLDITGGPVYVNSSNSEAARMVGSASMAYESMYIVGGYSGAFTPTPHTGEPPILDPLRDLPEPTVAGMTVYNAPLGRPGPGQTQSLLPGYYPGGWDVKGTLNLAPGIYAIGNNSGTVLSANAQGVINGTGGVMLYVRGSIGYSSANTNLNLLPPDPDVNSFPGADTYKGMAVFQTRTHQTNNSPWDITMPLSGSVTFHGTFYYPYGRVNVTASGSNDLGRTICWRFNGSGSGTVLVHWAGNQFAVAGPTYLVQ